MITFMSMMLFHHRGVLWVIDESQCVPLLMNEKKANEKREIEMRGRYGCSASSLELYFIKDCGWRLWLS